MSSVGFGLLKSVIDHRYSLSNLAHQGILEEHFIDKEVPAYLFIRNFMLEYGVHPVLDTVARHVEDLAVFAQLPGEPVEYWIAEVKQRKRHNDIRQCFMRVRECLEGHDIERALDEMGSTYISVRDSYSTRSLADLRTVQQEVLTKHDVIQRAGQMPGVSFGFPYIDNQSGGAQGGDYVVIAGQTGVGKTYLALKIGMSAHRSNKNVIFLSTEIPVLQAARRVLAMEGRFSTDDLKKGTLSYYGRERAQRIVEQGAALDSDSGYYFHLLPGGMFPKVEDFAIVVKELRPHLAIVDGAYLLQATSRAWWEKNMEVAQVLKNLALNEDLPIIGTYQYTKRETGKIEGVGGGFAIVQIASIVLSFEYERKEDIGSINEVQYRVLRLTKGRDGEAGSIRVRYNMLTTQLVQDRRLTGRVTDDELIEPDISDEMDSQDFAEI